MWLIPGRICAVWNRRRPDDTDRASHGFNRRLRVHLLRLDILTLAVLLVCSAQAPAGTDHTSWMVQRKYGLFLHYQYRILLGYSVRTKRQFPEPARMTAEEWN